MVTNDLAAWILELIAEGRLWKFYVGLAWRRLKQEVMDEQHHECQDCKDCGIIVTATQVHHENEIKVRPDLALSKYYINQTGERKRNLTCLCYVCHNKRHNRFGERESEPLTEERW